jgi:hypothetical protein
MAMYLAKAVFLVAAALGLAAAGYAKKPERRAPEKLVCKSQTETGSLARRKKECFTKEEWDKIGEAHRRGWSRAIDDMRTRPAGN